MTLATKLEALSITQTERFRRGWGPKAAYPLAGVLAGEKPGKGSGPDVVPGGAFLGHRGASGAVRSYDWCDKPVYRAGPRQRASVIKTAPGGLRGYIGGNRWMWGSLLLGRGSSSTGAPSIVAAKNLGVVPHCEHFFATTSVPFAQGCCVRSLISGTLSWFHASTKVSVAAFLRPSGPTSRRH